MKEKLRINNKIINGLREKTLSKKGREGLLPEEVSAPESPEETDIEKSVLEIERGLEKEINEPLEEIEKEVGNIPLGHEEVEDFIVEMDLGPILPPEFEGLDKAQKLKIIQDLKQRIVDIVKSDAQTQYSEDLKNRTSTGIKRMAESIKGSFTKERNIKNIEKKVFEEIKNTEEGRKLIAEDLKRLTEMTKGREISINDSGKPEIIYFNSSNIQNITREEEVSINNFNLIANKFTQIPYEWGQEKANLEIGRVQIATTHKKEYEKAKAEYEKAREEILKIKTSREMPENKGKVTLEMLQADSAIQMEQLLNTHPEFEKALDGFAKSGEGKDVWKNFTNTATGKNWINRGLIAGGFGARMLARNVAIVGITGATGATMCTALGAPVIGGIIGGIRGRIRGKENLQERQKQARHGQKDESKEKAKMVDVAPLIGGLEKMANEVEKATTDEERAKKLGKLAVVIEYSQDQIEKGQVNFGDAKSILANQFNFVNNLNRALVLREMNVEKINKELKEKISGAIKIKGEEVAGRISETQRKFITKQMWKGAALGVGLASAGYGARWFGEYMGWWGNHNVPKVFTFEASDPKAFLNPLPPETPISSPSTPFPQYNEGIKFENGKGGIQGILDLKKQILAQYNGDYSKAPESVQNFMETDATKQAIKLGFFDPNNSDGKESARIMAGSILKFDEQGNLLFGKPDASGNIPVLEKYQGRMFDSDHSADHNAGVAPETTASETELQKNANTEMLNKQAETYIDEEIKKMDVETLKKQIETHIDAETEKMDVADTPTEKLETYVPQNISSEEELSPRTIHMGSEVGVGSKISVGSVAETGGGYYGNRPEVIIIGRTEYFLDSSGQYHDAFGKPYFPEISPNENAILQNHPKFAENPFELSGKELMQVYKATLDDTKFLFNEPGTLSKLSGLKADNLLEYENETNGDPAVKRLSDYLKMLKNFTGPEGERLEPKSGFLGIGAETNQHYIIRAYQKLAELGNLEVFQASLRKEIRVILDA